MKKIYNNPITERVTLDPLMVIFNAQDNSVNSAQEGGDIIFE